jgi:RAB protein geranylgeranyltransferase component A
MEVILAAEEKHGVDTHMVIEAVPKHKDAPDKMEEADDTDVVWYVEFKDIVKTFFNFDEVKTFLLEEANANAPSMVIQIDNNGT